MSNWSDEETDEPLIADHRNFYKVEKWSKDDQLIGLTSSQCMSPPAPPGAPIFFRFALRGRRLRSLDLQPVIHSAGTVRGAEALRHDALAAEGTDVFVDDSTVAVVVLVEGDAVLVAVQ